MTAFFSLCAAMGTVNAAFDNPAAPPDLDRLQRKELHLLLVYAGQHGMPIQDANDLIERTSPWAGP